MPNHPNMPGVNSESDALREEARRLALSVGESYSRGQVFGEKLIHLDVASAENDPLVTSRDYAPARSMGIEQPERHALRSAEQSVGRAASERVLHVGMWIGHARQTHQHPGA